jgi:hypothetical protein
MDIDWEEFGRGMVLAATGFTLTIMAAMILDDVSILLTLVLVPAGWLLVFLGGRMILDSVGVFQ